MTKNEQTAHRYTFVYHCGRIEDADFEALGLLPDDDAIQSNDDTARALGFGYSDFRYLPDDIVGETINFSVHLRGKGKTEVPEALQVLQAYHSVVFLDGSTGTVATLLMPHFRDLWHFLLDAARITAMVDRAAAWDMPKASV